MVEQVPPNPAPPPDQPKEQIVESKSSETTSKLPWIIVTILLVLVGVFGGYFLLSQTQKNQTPSPTTAPTSPTSQTSPTPEPTEAKETKTFSSEKFKDLSFSGYSLQYPQDWTLSENRDEAVSPVSTVILTKDTYALKIYQAATGGAGCIYEGDLPESPASDYRNNEYKDLITGFATLRQTETPSGGKMSYNYCQKSKTEDSYGQPTNVGHMSVTTQVANPDTAIISEIEEIVKSIKTL
ncbi:MAG: hypothetical protein HY426_03395 [Candidatus Levybacteria bacterium]|nr:hypothetical protein [Candidatus Levybacteria bacterium]